MALAFAYEPLQDPSREIRLLRIAPGDPLRCQLSVHKTEEAPEYRAISYAWGDATYTHTIQVDGQDFAVRENCACALRQARQFFPEGTLIWLDAICINQADNAEKSAQVAMMGRIFSEARSVLVSVGEHYDDSKLVYDTAARLQTMSATSLGPCEGCNNTQHSEWYAHPSRRPRITLPHYHAYHTYMATVDTAEYIRLQSAFWNYHKRPYWERLWIIQETVRARELDVACGKSVTRCSNLEFLHDCLMKASTEKYPVYADRLQWINFQALAFPVQHTFYSFMHKTTTWRMPQDLQTCLLDLALYKCVDPRDRIYGLLDLIKWGKKGPPAPDYEMDSFLLALQVLKAAGRPVLSAQGPFHTRSSLSWPQIITDLFEALDICNLDAGNPTPCSGAGAISPHVWPERCDCNISTVAEIGCIDALRYSKGFVIDADISQTARRQPHEVVEATKRHDLRDGDILIPVFRDTGTVPYPGFTRFCLVLRKVHSNYFEVLNEAPRVKAEEMLELQQLIDFQDGLSLCLNTTDAAFLVRSLHRLERRVGPHDPIDDTRHTWQHEQHERLPMSSYAIMGKDCGNVRTVMGAPSADGGSIPCARCGGLFEPSEEMLAEYAKNEDSLSQPT